MTTEQLNDFMLSGNEIKGRSPEHGLMHKVSEEARSITAELNSGYHTREEIRLMMSRLTGREVDKSFGMFPPFYSDYGRNIMLGRNVFINHACTFMDRGGITLEDDVFIGPKVCLITENHGLREEERRTLNSHPIRVCKGAWIGAGAIVLPGVTIGEYAVVGAGSVVTHDVPDHVVAAGNPAKIIKSTEEKV